VRLKSALPSQMARYERFYEGWRRLEGVLRFDVRYRCRRMQEVLAALGVGVEGRRVLDVGFGWGHMLLTFPASCQLWGVDISPSAVDTAARDPRFQAYAHASFHTVREEDPTDLPRGPFDIIVCSHVLEHVPDDRALLRALRNRLAPGGILVIFVPVEPPDYNLIHLRSYSLQTISERVAQAGVELLHGEGSMYVEGHVWRLLTIPARRAWPVLGIAASGLRHGFFSLVPYPLSFHADRLLFHLGLSAGQALVIGRKTSGRLQPI
jgi:SAM-dependent methyltransferase